MVFIYTYISETLRRNPLTDALCSLYFLPPDRDVPRFDALSVELFDIHNVRAHALAGINMRSHVLRQVISAEKSENTL